VDEKIKASEQRTREYITVEVKRLDQRINNLESRIELITWEALGLIILLFGIPQFYTWFSSMRKEKPNVKSIIETIQSMNDKELSELKKALKI
jgi:hypothetical protein